MLERIRRAIVLDRSLYRQVADDSTYTGEAVIIVVVASILAAVGVLGPRSTAGSFVAQVFNGILFGWLAWAALAAAIASGLGGRTRFSEMLRALGYANAPRFIAVLGLIPLIGWIFQLGAGILALIAGIIAIREAAEFSTGRAIATGILGLLLYIVAGVIIGLIVAGGALLF